MKQTPNESLDRLTKVVARAGGISEQEADRIGSSHFLYARLRAGIEAERHCRAEKGTGLLINWLVASRAIAVLVVVTIASVMTFWFSKANASVSSPPSRASGDDIARVVAGGACALSTTDECAISTEEVLATLFAENEGEEPK